MPLRLFEVCCVVIIVMTLGVTARRTPARSLLIDYARLAVASWVGEESSVAVYRFYAYAPAWDARIHHVPLLVPLIWPLVILSAERVSRALAPGAGGAGRALLVGAIVTLDASLVEVVAVRAGLWSWAEPGHLSVPLIGILGWAYFAASASFVLDRTRGAWRWLVVLLAPLGTHALLVLSWWGLFRWTLRGDLGTGSVRGIAAVGLFACFAAIGLRRLGRDIPLEEATPRMIAASLFLALLLTTAPTNVPLWIHTLAVAAPYVAATRFTASRSPEARA